jgi:hypothetical protein
VFLRLELLPHRFERRDRFAGNFPAAQGKRDRPAVDGRGDALSHKPCQADFRDPAVVMQYWSSLSLELDQGIHSMDKSTRWLPGIQPP